MQQPSFRSLTRSLACAAILLLFMGLFLGPVGRAAAAAPGGTYQTAATPPQVVDNPFPLTIYSNRGVTFTSTASGSPAPTVQWQVSVDNGATFTDISGATSTALVFTAQITDNGNQYRAVFTNPFGTATSQAATLTVLLHILPSITLQPTDQMVAPGSTASFSAAATAAPDPLVQWQVSTDSGVTFNDIPGANSTTLSFTAQLADSGSQYRAVFNSLNDLAITNAATLTVAEAPAIADNPFPLTIYSNRGVTFTATASGSPAPTVQWQVSADNGATFTNIPGATSTALVFTAQITDNGKQYRAVFTNIAGTATSQAATLTVLLHILPSITLQPANQTVTPGSTASFSAAATAAPDPLIQWQVSTDNGATFNDIPGANATTFSFTAQLTDNGKQYRAVFNSLNDLAITNAATLTVTNNIPPAITLQPTNQLAGAGSPVSFSAAASGFPAPSVQWQVSADGGTTFSNISGATATTLSFTALVADSGKQFRAAFVNAAGSAVTNAAKLTVDGTPPVITPNITGTLGNNGWYTSNVAVTWSVTDPESAVTFTMGCDPSAVPGDTPGVTFTCTATSLGGTASQQVTIKRDSTPPVFGACPAPASFVLNTGSKTVGPITVDASISGLASSTLTGTVSTNSIGAKTVTFRAADNAGNSASKVCNYAVIYAFSGFYTPLANPPALNQFNAGNSVPVKFGLNGYQGLNILASGSPTSQPVDCTTLAPTGSAASTNPSGKDGLTYNAKTGLYTYSWKTAKSWAGTCRVLTVKLADGTAHMAYFKFK